MVADRQTGPADSGDTTSREGKRPAPAKTPDVAQVPAEEIGGPPGPEPTRYGDWERGGRCIDF